MDGTIVAEATLYQTPGSVGRIRGLERIAGRIGDREGSFHVKHSGIRDTDGGVPAFGDVVPGSGTGGSQGATGSMQIARKDSGEYFDLDLEVD